MAFMPKNQLSLSEYCFIHFRHLVIDSCILLKLNLRSICCVFVVQLVLDNNSKSNQWSLSISVIEVMPLLSAWRGSRVFSRKSPVISSWSIDIWKSVKNNNCFFEMVSDNLNFGLVPWLYYTVRPKFSLVQHGGWSSVRSLIQGIALS